MLGRETLFALAETLGGLPVLGCLDGSPAARAGIRYGDIVLAVNGRPVKSFADFVEAKELREDGMDVVVFRGGREQSWSLEFAPRRGLVDTASLLAELATMRLIPT